MSFTESYAFVPKILPTRDNAESIQKLILQDVELGGFENPLKIADPSNTEKVNSQINKLINNPDRYSGFKNKHEQLVAFVKASEWTVNDEMPFVKSILSKRALQISGLISNKSLHPSEFGIFGLVVEESIDSSSQEEIIFKLLLRSIGQAALHSMNYLNIVMHDKDPVLPVANDMGFKPHGDRGIAAGAPGLVQQRYQLKL